MGQLSREDREALADYYKEKEYDPTKDPAQDTDGFARQMLCDGGMAGKNYSDGGPVMEAAPDDTMSAADYPGESPDAALSALSPGMAAAQRRLPTGQGQPFTDISVSPDDPALADAARGSLALAQAPKEPPLNLSVGPNDPALKQVMAMNAAAQAMPKPQPVAMHDAVAQPKPSLNPADLGFYAKALEQDQPGQQATPQVSPVKSLDRNQFDDLIKALSQKPTAGQRASRGLAALADGIISGVARAPSPGFERNVQEAQQQRQEALARALELKYGMGLKGQELQNAMAKMKADIENQQAERRLEERGQNIESSKAAAELAQQQDQLRFEQGKESREAAQNEQQKQIEAANLPATGFLHPSTWGKGPQVEALRQKLLGGVDQHAQAVAWARAHPNDPRAARILQINGQ